MGERRILTIAGTRPEAVKVAHVARLLGRHVGIHHRLVATGQHGAGFHTTLGYFGVAADGDLALPNRGPDAFAEEIARAVPSLIEAFAPDLLLVQGDTTSAWAAALAGAACGIPIGHIEAGLRSGNPRIPWPEERNRIEIDDLSALLFAPSEAAAGNLVGVSGEVHVTGNTAIDALLELRDRSPPTLHDSARKLILVTCHRREAIPCLADLAQALIRIADRPDVDILLPVHGNPAVGEPLRRLLGGHPRIRLTDPLPYPELVRLMQVAHLLLTDSGGLQEEAPALGLPTLVLRDITERPEVFASGNARLVGLDPDRIVRNTIRLLDDVGAHAAMCRPAFPYGKGDAAPRMVEAITRWLGLPFAPLHDRATSYANYR
ncbi:UDP-N-acetylglucosamine 2-epimerase (non-hydrolyzing) [uncultured Sphingomonas sp.]|uniref:non-hydrolyzing UDP-N-acetylglucosamine 2-epimerase n=1 Tax=uncultured Sphingomonas sp. TaxID=158754 RepID=UPI0025E6885F|nr:UDP-N-acetylglucosamine 2-epimerase (non-hydrolyzing) [uncultured Sphingomonas sp.]